MGVGVQNASKLYHVAGGPKNACASEAYTKNACAYHVLTNEPVQGLTDLQRFMEDEGSGGKERVGKG